MAWRSTVIVWVVLSGCVPAAAVGGAASRLEIGTGAQAYVAVADGDTLGLVRGCQGAQHVWVSLRAWGLASERATVELALVRDRGGAPVSARFEAKLALMEPPGEVFRELGGLALIVPEPDQALGERLTLLASVRGDGGGALTAARSIAIAWDESRGCAPQPSVASDAGVATDARTAVGESDAGVALLDPPRFTDVTELAGLAAARLQPAACVLDVSPGCEVDRMTGGAATGDVDGDGWPDLYLTMLEGAGRLYRNLGDGTFADVTSSAGLAEHAFAGNGAAFVDVESDGDLDLYVTAIANADDPSARHFLFVNDGTGRFTEDAIARGVALDDGRLHVGQSVATGDFDRDGYPDLHVTEWTPRAVLRPHTRLLHNRGAAAPGTFEDVTRAAGALTFSERCWDETVECSQYAFAGAFSDLDDDGWPDLVVVSDFGLTRSFWNRGDGTFGPGFFARTMEGDENGMGSTIGDVDGDGDLDWFVSSIRDPDSLCASGGCYWGTTGNRLYRNAGARAFEDATDFAGVRDAGWGWGSALFDADDDGDLDLVATAGIDFPTLSAEDAFHDDPTRLWINDGRGAMQERAMAAGIGGAIGGKGLLVLDFDRDGDLDVLVVSNEGSPHLYRNDGPTGSYLRVVARAATGNAEALGARVWVRAYAGGPRQVRELASTSHFLGQSERTAHFGLGPDVARVAELDIRWPNGRTTHLTDVEANRTLELVEPPP